jgi:threonylcarbamoyladenosine tRNA methylthiotransferase MtaB
VEAGGHELVLSGINLGRWGRDLHGAPTLAGIIRRIFDKTELARLRVSSVEPMDWDEPMMHLFHEFASGTEYSNGQQPRLARHAHLPLQSGCDRTLRRMYRRYRPWHYAAKLEEIRRIVPEAAIGADVMVGFPGESDVDFCESYDFIAAQPFTYLHLFPFSARPGTPGWELHQQQPVHGSAVQERLSALRELMANKRKKFAASLAGKPLPAISLHGSKALTDNYLEVSVQAGTPANRLGWVLLREGLEQAEWQDEPLLQNHRKSIAGDAILTSASLR